MDIFLRFKNKKHADAYSCDLEYQVQRRIVMLGIGGSVSIAIFPLMSQFVPKVVNRTSQILLTLRFIFMVLNFIGHLLLKKYMHRLKPLVPTLINVLDLTSVASLFVIYPIAGNVSIDDFSKLGVYVWAWSAALGTISAYLILASWWMKFLNASLQMAFFLYFVVKREPIYSPILIFGFTGMMTFVFLSYTQELFKKKDFLEKRKIYDNYEALMRIFDDICQGIIIMDTKFNITYANRTVDAMFNRQSSQKVVKIEELFAEIQVKAVIPSVVPLITERVLLSPDSIQVNNVLLLRFQ